MRVILRILPREYSCPMMRPLATGIANTWRSGSFLSFNSKKRQRGFPAGTPDPPSTPQHISSAQRRTSCCEPQSERRDPSAMAHSQPGLGVNCSSRKPAMAATQPYDIPHGVYISAENRGRTDMWCRGALQTARSRASMMHSRRFFQGRRALRTQKYLLHRVE